MGIGIVIAVLLAAVGSILWVMPSRSEKIRTRLRIHAMKQGLRVRLLDVSLMQNCFKWLKDPRGWVLYELHTPLISANSEAFKPFGIRLTAEENPRDDEEPIALQQRALALTWPPSVEALLCHTGGLSLLWSERFDVSVELKDAEITALMQAIKDNLTQCAALALATKPWHDSNG